MKILIISYYFPPFNTIGAVRVGKIAKHFNRFGNDIRVITARKQPFQPALQLEIPSKNVIYTNWLDVKKPSWFFSGGQKRVGKGDIPLEAWRQELKQSKIWAFYKTLMCFPDDQIGWFPFAFIAASRLMKTWKPAVIYASGMPFTSLCVASFLSHKYAIPWVAELRDLWTDNHYYSHPNFRRVIEERVEHKVLSSASGLVTVSEPLANTLRVKFNKPTEVVLNGIDIKDYRRHSSVPFRKGTIRIVYTGMIYEGKRDPSPLFEALKLLAPFNRKIEVAFYGFNLNILQEMVSRYGLKPFVDLNFPVSYKESLRIQSEADILLLLLWNDPREHGVFTGKLFEYLGARRPILAIAHPDNVAAELILSRKAGVVLSDSDRIAEQLKEWINHKHQTGMIPFNPKEVTEGLSRELQAKVLLDHLTNIIRTENSN